MGGTHSEPATAVDLGHDIMELYDDVQIQQRCGWHFPGLQLDQVLAAAMHVDDALLSSKILCEECMLRGCKTLFLDDVGISMEEHGTEVRFLQYRVKQDSGGALVLPYSSNEEFALGLTSHPRVSRLQSYVLGETPESTLRQFIVSQVICQSRVSNKANLHHMAQPLFIVIAQASRLGWPCAMTVSHGSI